MTGRLSNGQHTVKPPQHTAAGTALTNLLVEVVRLAEFFTQTGESLARPEGQTLARWLVLETLASGPKPVAEVARRLRLARQSVQRVADLLAHDGLVAYEANPRHRRAKLACLTPPGVEVLHRIQHEQREWSDRRGAEIDLGELESTADTLRRIRGILTAAGSPASHGHRVDDEQPETRAPNGGENRSAVRRT